MHEVHVSISNVRWPSTVLEVFCLPWWDNSDLHQCQCLSVAFGGSTSSSFLNHLWHSNTASNSVLEWFHRCDMHAPTKKLQCTPLPVLKSARSSIMCSKEVMASAYRPILTKTVPMFWRILSLIPLCTSEIWSRAMRYILRAFAYLPCSTHIFPMFTRSRPKVDTSTEHLYLSLNTTHSTSSTEQLLLNNKIISIISSLIILSGMICMAKIEQYLHLKTSGYD